MEPVIVVGMHRSGTSAVAGLIRNFGLNFGSNLLTATGDNIHGHFEEAAFIRFHDALISRIFSDRAPFCKWLPLANVNAVYTDRERTEARAVWNTHRATGGNSWKDPRTSLFLDLWTETLPEAKVIVCLRHPYQVHHSLLRRGAPFLQADYGSAIRGWTVYNQRILRALSGLPRSRFIVLDVETAFTNPIQLTEGLSRFLDIPVPEAVAEAITPEIFHFEGQMSTALAHFENFLPEAGSVYRHLKQMDYLHPIDLTVGTSDSRSDQSEEARLIEFEEAYGLRANARKMLIRSITVDRQRTLALYEQAMKASEEKDGMIDDLSRLNDLLSGRSSSFPGPYRPQPGSSASRSDRGKLRQPALG